MEIGEDLGAGCGVFYFQIVRCGGSLVVMGVICEVFGQIEEYEGRFGATRARL